MGGIAAWISFDKWASWWLGLDESKYEWAKYERQAMEEEELENIATNNMTTQKVDLSKCYTGGLCSTKGHV